MLALTVFFFSYSCSTKFSRYFWQGFTGNYDMWQFLKKPQRNWLKEG